MQSHGSTTALAEGIRNGALINTVFPNMKKLSKATIAAVVVRHGLGE